MRAPRNLPFILKIYFIVGSVVLVTFALYYNNSLIKRMHTQSRSIERLLNHHIAIGLKDVSDKDREGLILEVLNLSDRPGFITDAAGRPMLWRNIGIDQVGDDEYTRLLNYSPEFRNDPLLNEVLDKAEEFDRVNDPIRIMTENGVIDLHFGHQRLTRELALAPYVQLAVYVIFVLFGFLGFRAMKTGEQRSIWIGMAKETAHQLGTPLSSMMGWVTIMKEETGKEGCSERLKKAAEETAADIDRLSGISARFSKIGSMPKLEYHELVPIIEETVEYFERRRPAMRINSTINIEVGELPLIRCSRELLGWVFENLMKNSLDAIAGKEGKINISGSINNRSNSVDIIFSDTGKGMNSNIRSRIFSPGFTTKNRGWGLGLALVRRIVTDIHRGSIKVLDTQPGKGTSFLISLPVD